MSKLKAIGSHLATLKPTVGFLQQEKRGETATRLAYAPWRRWYSTERWRKLRIAIFERDGFTCQWPGCGRVEGNTSRLVADHKIKHRGDIRLFWDENNLQTLCKPCHDGAKQRAEQGAPL
ncbi:HNH endonuclease signature motif containing protein [Sphingobium sp. WCS2017Hpa-17]|uniref:HNH endonuclease n=1 Tax=Sphingobium sp. WCS2017Hpa-17 TaxID=3073638 RepID=UPI00288C446C|nr:HNH endonuclease signature motif containing protein [Sphingobium sp. WCS2017Hpa-17]